MKKTYYYRSFDEDIIKNAGQDYTLPPNYKWINDGKLHALAFRIFYNTVKSIARIYCRFFMHVRFIGQEAINECKGRGCFIYANHTQPFGDVIIPAIAAARHRIAVVVSPANLGIPVIGRFLPGLGAVPVPDDWGRMQEFVDALKILIDRGYCVVIYPEAHVWPYYTGIRPFSTSSFHYPVEMDAPVFCMTMTYQKRSHGRPKATCYIDRCDLTAMENTGRRKQISTLHDTVLRIMKSRSLKSNCQYCKYIKIEEERNQ